MGPITGECFAITQVGTIDVVNTTLYTQGEEDLPGPGRTKDRVISKGKNNIRGWKYR